MPDETDGWYVEYELTKEQAKKYDLTIYHASAATDSTDSDFQKTEGSDTKGKTKNFSMPTYAEQADTNTPVRASVVRDMGFVPRYTPASVPVKGSKTLSGNRKTADIESGQFTFKVTAATANDASGYQKVPTSDISVSQGGEIEFTAPGIYRYEVTEKGGNAYGFIYDERVYRATFTVVEANGSLKVTRSISDGTNVNLTGVEFINKYQSESPDTGVDGDSRFWGGVLMLCMIGMILFFIGRRRYAIKNKA